MSSQSDYDDHYEDETISEEAIAGHAKDIREELANDPAGIKKLMHDADIDGQDLLAVIIQGELEVDEDTFVVWRKHELEIVMSSVNAAIKNLATKRYEASK